jgi:hypothetical protein
LGSKAETNRNGVFIRVGLAGKQKLFSFLFVDDGVLGGTCGMKVFFFFCSGFLGSRSSHWFSWKWGKGFVGCSFFSLSAGAFFCQWRFCDHGQRLRALVARESQLVSVSLSLHARDIEHIWFLTGLDFLGSSFFGKACCLQLLGY